MNSPLTDNEKAIIREMGDFEIMALRTLAARRECLFLIIGRENPGRAENLREETEREFNRRGL